MSVSDPEQKQSYVAQAALGNSVKFTWQSSVMVHAHSHARDVV